jgi:copper chaperone CopZ
MRLLSISVLFTMILVSCSNEPKTVVQKSAHVYGNCEKCKATIEKAAKIEGVTEVAWNADSKLLTVKLDSLQTNVDDVLKSVAASGYDNEKYHGDDYAYQKLPSCCQYERRDH